MELWGLLGIAQHWASVCAPPHTALTGDPSSGPRLLQQTGHQLSHLPGPSLLLLRLAREQARVRDLKSGNQQLEEQRAELVERLQAMLQAHWEEANQLLSTTLLPPNPQVAIAPESSCPAQIALFSMVIALQMCPVPLGIILWFCACE